MSTLKVSDIKHESFTGTTQLKLDSAGRLLVGTTTEGQANADNLTIDGGDAETGITIRSGTSRGNHIYFSDGTSGDDEYKGIISYQHSDNKMQFFTNASERMRIDSAGKVGIGETTLDALLVIKGASDASTTPSIRLKDGSDTREAWISNASGDLVLANGGDDNTPHCKLTMFDGNLMQFSTANTERMRIDSSGMLLFGKTVDNTATGSGILISSNGNSRYSHTGTGDHDFLEFNRGTDGSMTRIGLIRTSGSGTIYNTTSDYRLKENAVSISDGITRLKTLKPYRFNFKIEPDKTVDGFFAHEVTAVPEAITGTKDEVDSDNNPVYQGIDQSKLVPLLVAALQEAIVRIEALEAK